MIGAVVGCGRFRIEDTRRLEGRQPLQHVLLVRAGAAGDLPCVVFREQRILDGRQNAERIGDGAGAALGTRKVPVSQPSVDAVFQQRLRLVDQGLQLLAAVSVDELGGIEVIGQRDGEQVDAGGAGLGRHGRVDELQGSIRGALTRGVAIEQIHDAVAGMTREHADVRAGESRSQGGDRIADAGLVHGDDVGVALRYHGNARGRHGRLRLVERIEHAALVEQRRFLAVQVLRLAFADHAPAEGYALALLVFDGEHHAIEESVAHAPIGADDSDVCLDHLVGLEALRCQMAHKRALSRREAEHPGFRDIAAQPALRKVGARGAGLRAFAAHELHMKELRSLRAHGAQPRFCALSHAGSAFRLVIGDVDMGALCQVAHRFGKRQVLGFHDEGEHVAAFPAAEAMP